MSGDSGGSIVGFFFTILSILAIMNYDIVLEWVNGFTGVEWLLAATVGYGVLIIGAIYLLVIAAVVTAVIIATVVAIFSLIGEKLS